MTRAQCEAFLRAEMGSRFCFLEEELYCVKVTMVGELLPWEELRIRENLPCTIDFQVIKAVEAEGVTVQEGRLLS